jgi:hypothetical protein
MHFICSIKSIFYINKPGIAIHFFCFFTFIILHKMQTTASKMFILCLSCQDCRGICNKNNVQVYFLKQQKYEGNEGDLNVLRGNIHCSVYS